MKKKKHTLDDLSSEDFPGIDPDLFFEWWKERVILDEERKPMNPNSVLTFNRSVDYFLYKRLVTFPQFLKCKRIQKKSGITKEMIKSALASPKNPKS